jgi:hypothetical protein
MKIQKSIFKGTLIQIGKLNYVNAQYISKTLNDNDSKINYSKSISINSTKYFLLCK